MPSISLSAFSQTMCSKLIIASSLSLGLLACSPQINHHGHRLTKQEVEQIQPGMTKEQVKLAFGTPDTTASVGGGAYYYISSKTKKSAFFKPRVIDRRVIAVYFNKNQNVERVAHYGLKDGKVVNFVGRETPSHGQDSTLVTQIFRNLGRQAGSLIKP